MVNRSVGRSVGGEMGEREEYVRRECGMLCLWLFFFFFQAEDGIRDISV